MKEYSECELKAQFLTVPKSEFDLFETILWEPGTGYRHLHLHLERLERSSQYFQFKYDLDVIQYELNSADKELQARKKPMRVRLTLKASGDLKIQTQEVEQLGQAIVALSELRTDSTDRFLFHKTTARELYEKEHAAAKARGYFDVIFRNERNEITEGAISNVFIEKQGKLFTPPVNSGLLAGTFRRNVLESGNWDAYEKILTIEDLRNADEIYVTNAIRGLLPVKINL